MPDINTYAPKTGRQVKDDGTVINMADMLADSNEIIATETVSATATGAEVDVALPTLVNPEGLYSICVANSATGAALTVVLQNKETFGEGEETTTVYAQLTSFEVAADSAVSVLAQGFLIGEAGRLALSCTEGIEALIKIRKA